MSNFTISPNMNLIIPTPGVDPGPDYATNQNNDLTIIDQHNHSSGSGVQINPAGLNINADLPYNINNLILVRSVRFSPQGSPLALASDIGCLYESGVDLYYNDGSGNQIRITQSGSVAGSSGTITGLPSGTASASFGAGTFVFQSATNTAANIDGGSFIFRNNTVSSKGLTLSPPNAMAANYSLVLPSIPGANAFVTLDTSGNLSTGSNIPASQIASSSITGAQLVTNINLPGSAVQENGLNLVVSNTNATQSLSIVRGSFNGSGVRFTGEGVTAVHAGTGNYTVTIDTAFSDTPSPMVCVNASGNFTGTITQVSSVVFQVLIFAANTAAASDQSFTVFITGQRA